MMDSLILQCEICQKTDDKVTRDEQLAGHAVCSDCAKGQSPTELMERLVIAKENLRRLCHEILESTAWELEHLRGEIERRRSQAHAHLQVVNADFRRSQREEQSLRRQVLRWADRTETERRRERIETLRHHPAGAMRLEIFYSKGDRRFVRRVLADGRVIETRYFAESRREEIRECIDVGHRIRIPWKTIRAEGSWSAEVPLCPYYLDRVWQPQNVLSL